MPVPETKPPYILLENIMRSESSSDCSMHSRGFYIISLNGKKQLKMGRGHESDLRIPDV